MIGIFDDMNNNEKIPYTLEEYPTENQNPYDYSSGLDDGKGAQDFEIQGNGLLEKVLNGGRIGNLIRDRRGFGANKMNHFFRDRKSYGSDRMNHMFRDRKSLGTDRMSHMFRDRRGLGSDRMSHMFRDRKAFGADKMSHLFRDKKALDRYE